VKQQRVLTRMLSRSSTNRCRMAFHSGQLLELRLGFSRETFGYKAAAVVPAQTDLCFVDRDLKMDPRFTEKKCLR